MSYIKLLTFCHVKSFTVGSLVMIPTYPADCCLAVGVKDRLSAGADLVLGITSDLASGRGVALFSGKIVVREFREDKYHQT